ncbi:MAG TPA: glycosyltransferase [Polyangiaceae bacterium]|nr:glycosyltransferase [Polyangiaceae bacterium]
MNPDFSIVIPVFNEAALLETSVSELAQRLDALGWNFEIVLAENGSNDGTRPLAAGLARRLRRVRAVFGDEPNYGKALKQGILATRAPLVLCDEIDLCDVDFHTRAVARLNEDAADLVVGSKVAGGAHDRRPLLRRAGTLAYTTLLRALVGFRGTDTHGPKAFRRDRLVPVVERCVVDRDVFASELVIRASRAGLRVVELPILVAEKRPPSVHLLRRVPNVVTKLLTLRRALGRR